MVKNESIWLKNESIWLKISYLNFYRPHGGPGAWGPWGNPWGGPGGVTVFSAYVVFIRYIGLSGLG